MAFKRKLKMKIPMLDRQEEFCFCVVKIGNEKDLSNILDIVNYFTTFFDFILCILRFFLERCIQITNLITNTFETARIYSILLNIWNQPTLSHQHEMFDVSKKISAPKGNCKALYGDCWFIYKCIKNLNAGINAIKLSINCDRNAFSIYFFTPLE